MVNVKKKFIMYSYIILTIIHFSYVFNEHRFNEVDQEIEIKHEQNNINKFILKHKSIDAIIIGGSNSAVGLSAKLLSEITNKNFYNLSQSSEGDNSTNYYKTVISKTSSLDKKKVRLILYSTLKYLNSDETEFKEYYNSTKKNKIKLIPKINILGRFISAGTINSILTNFNKNSISPKMNNDKKYGEGSFKTHFNINLKSFEFNKSISLDLVIKSLIDIKRKYNKSFPNAKFVVVTPLIYNKNPEFQNVFISKLSCELEKNEIEFISQPPVTSIQPIWTDAIHLNHEGRKLRTNELYKLLRNKYNLKSLFYEN